MQTGFRVKVLAGEAQVAHDIGAVTIDIAVDCGLAEGGILGRPDGRASATREQHWGADLVGVNVVRGGDGATATYALSPHTRCQQDTNL